MSWLKFGLPLVRTAVLKWKLGRACLFLGCAPWTILVHCCVSSHTWSSLLGCFLAQLLAGLVFTAWCSLAFPWWHWPEMRSIQPLSVQHCANVWQRIFAAGLRLWWLAICWFGRRSCVPGRYACFLPRLVGHLPWSDRCPFFSDILEFGRTSGQSKRKADKVTQSEDEGSDSLGSEASDAEKPETTPKKKDDKENKTGRKDKKSKKEKKTPNKQGSAKKGEKKDKKEKKEKPKQWLVSVCSVARLSWSFDVGLWSCDIWSPGALKKALPCFWVSQCTRELVAVSWQGLWSISVKSKLCDNFSYSLDKRPSMTFRPGPWRLYSPWTFDGARQKMQSATRQYGDPASLRLEAFGGSGPGPPECLSEVFLSTQKCCCLFSISSLGFGWVIPALCFKPSDCFA